MKIKKLTALWSVILAIGLALGGVGCKSEPLPVPPPPQATDINPAAKPAASPPIAKTATPTPTQIPIPTPTATPTPAATPTPSPLPEPAFTKFETNSAEIIFPDKITFKLKASNADVVQAVSLEYGTDERTLSPNTRKTTVEFKEGKEVEVSWDWEMKKTGSIPPGATVWWRWVYTEADGKVNNTAKKTIVYTDTRFSWQVIKLAEMDIYWYGRNEALVNELADEVQAKLSRIQLNVAIPPERKPKIFVYTSSEELKDAILFAQEWTGALAFPRYNIVLTAVNSGNLDWAKRALPHEITHLIVGEAVFGPFGEVPAWLNEGLAQYSEGPMADYLEQVLNKAALENKLISLRSLSGSFPTQSSGAYLAYAESDSIVRYLVDTYGWEKMRLLLSKFKDGSTYDKALQEVYSFDINGLETKWKSTLKGS